MKITYTAEGMRVFAEDLRDEAYIENILGFKKDKDTFTVKRYHCPEAFSGFGLIIEKGEKTPTKKLSKKSREFLEGDEPFDFEDEGNEVAEITLDYILAHPQEKFTGKSEAIRMLITALLTDGGHHKQWCAEEALKALGVDMKELKAGLNKDDYDWEEGIPP